jgi:DNA polymerase-3 subunit beta
MKLTIERAALLKALGHVQSVVERRNTIPILSNVLLSANDGHVAFSATDLDMEIADSSPAQVEGAGQITAPAHTLYEIVRKLPEGADVSLSYTGEDPRLQVHAGRSRFNLPVLPAGDFPMMSSDGLSDPIGIDTNDLTRLIDKTRFAISTEETRYYLNGLYLHAVVEEGQSKLRAVATDGRRLALAEMPAPDGFAGAPGVIIPRKTINEVRRLMDDAGEIVTMGVSAQKVRFGFDHAAMTSKVIDGSFPPYERVIPRDNKRVIMLDNALFAAAVDRVATISTEQSRAVRLQHGRWPGGRGAGDRLRRRAVRDRLQRALPARRHRPDRRRDRRVPLRRAGRRRHADGPDAGARPHRRGRPVRADAAPRLGCLQNRERRPLVAAPGAPGRYYQ